MASRHVSMEHTIGAIAGNIAKCTDVGVCRAAAALKPDVVLELWRSLGADELRPLMRILAERCDSATREELAIVLHQSALKSERLKHLDKEERMTHEQARALDAKPGSAPASPVSSSTPPKRDPKLKGAKDTGAAASSPGRKKLRSGRAYGQKPGSEDAENAVGEEQLSPPSGPVSKARLVAQRMLDGLFVTRSTLPCPSQVFATVDLLVLIMQLQDFTSMHRMIATCPQLRKVIDGPTAARALQYVAREAGVDAANVAVPPQIIAPAGNDNSAVAMAARAAAERAAAAASPALPLHNLRTQLLAALVGVDAAYDKLYTLKDRAEYGRGTIYLAKEKLTKFQVLLKEVRYSSSGPPIGRPLLEAPGGSVAAGAQGDEPDGAIGLLQGGRFGGAWVDAAQAVASNAIMLSGVAGEERFETGVSADTVRETALLCDLVHEAPHPNLTRMYVLFPKLRGEMVWATHGFCDSTNLLNEWVEAQRPEKRLSITLARKVAHQVLTALSVLHARGIMHRNLTGQAVLLSRGGKAQVAILDLARERPRDGAPLSPWAFARAQIAPECLLSARRYGSEADVYSVGMLLVMMLGRDEVAKHKSTPEESLADIFRAFGTTIDDVGDLARLASWEDSLLPDPDDPEERESCGDLWRALDKRELALTPDDKELMRSLLTVDPTRRMTVDAALDHPAFEHEDARSLSGARAKPLKPRGSSSSRSAVSATYDLAATRLEDAIAISEVANANAQGDPATNSVWVSRCARAAAIDQPPPPPGRAAPPTPPKGPSEGTTRRRSNSSARGASLAAGAMTSPGAAALDADGEVADAAAQARRAAAAAKAAHEAAAQAAAAAVMAAPTFGEGKRKRGLKGAAAKGALASSTLYNASRPLLAAASADPCMSAAAFAAATAAASPATAQHVRARRAAAAEAAAVHAASTHVLVTEENALMRRRGVRGGEALGGIGARDAYYGRNSRHAGAMLRGGARPRVEAARAESAACLTYDPKDASANSRGVCHVEINPWMRAVLVDWLADIHDRLAMQPRTIHLAVHVFDEYVWRAERPLLGRELQLYGLAALSLSSKFQEDEAIFVEDLEYLCDAAYTVEHVRAAEGEIFRACSTRLSASTAYDHVRGAIDAPGAWIPPADAPALAAAAAATRGPTGPMTSPKERLSVLRLIAVHLCERALQEPAMRAYAPRIVAAACVRLARSTLRGRRATCAKLPSVHFAAAAMRNAAAGGADDGEVLSRATATATAEEDGDDGDDAVLVEAALVDLFAVRTELTAKPLGGRRDAVTLAAEEAASATAMDADDDDDDDDPSFEVQQLNAIDRKHRVAVSAAREMPPPLLLGLALAGCEVRR